MPRAELGVRAGFWVLEVGLNLVTGPGLVTNADRGRRGIQVIMELPQKSVLCPVPWKDEALRSMIWTKVGAIVHSSRVAIQHLF